MKGVAAGAGAAALAPVVMKTAGKLARGLGADNLEDVVKSPGDALAGAASNLGDRVISSVIDQAKGAIAEAGGPGGILKDAVKGMLPFGGGDGGGGNGGVPGVGKGRRMPVQQSVDIGLPIETVYNQWTQFEDWPRFMHRVTRVTQEDDCTVSFATKIWGKTKEFTASIETQRPEKRIKWRVSQGMTHTGVVTFHELGPELTRVLLGFDVAPGSLIEKFARGARNVKRAARAELHRFKAFIEMAEQETGAWRGVIEEGELVEEHDPSYDEQRQYSDIEELTSQQDADEEDDAEKRQDDESESNAEELPTVKRSSRQQRSRGRHRQRGESSRGDRQSQSGRQRRQSESSDKTRARGRSSRGQSGNGSTASSRSSSRSRASRASSSGQSGSRGRNRSQSRKS